MRSSRTRSKQTAPIPEPDSLVPHASVVFAIDPSGSNSGYAVLTQGKLLESGIAKNAEERRYSVELAKNTASERGLPLVVVMEDFSPGWKSHKALVGASQGRGRWLEALELAGIWSHVAVLPQSWRSKIFGKLGRAERDQLKKIAVTHVLSRFLVRVKDDEAEAILIGCWATHSKEADPINPPEKRKKTKPSKRTSDSDT